MKLLETWFWLGTPPKTTAQTRRHGRTGSYRSQRHKLAVATLQAVAEAHAPAKPHPGALRVEITFYFLDPKAEEARPRTRRPDADNLAKDMLDALMHTGHIVEDAQVSMLAVSKWDAPFEGIGVTIHQMPTSITELEELYRHEC